MVFTNGAQPDLSEETLPPVERHATLVREWKDWYARHRSRFP